jgi:hypothetical protein
MPDLPAPHHSAALNRMLGLPPLHPDLEPPIPAAQTAALLADRRRRLARRRTGADRARARRQTAA